MLKILLIMGGGGVGALFRYLLAGWGQALTNSSFPLGTLVVNSTGCLFFGALGAIFAGPHLIREEYRFALLVGVLGAFTTFSTFGWETFALAKEGDLRFAMLNIVLSNALALVCIWIGYRVTEKCFGA